MENTNTQEYFGLKELHSVVIRARGSLTFGNRQFEDGEPVLYFEKVQISNLKEGNKIKAARGGWGNYPHVIWQDFNDMTFRISEGVLSKMSFSILSNAGIFDKGDKVEDIIKVPKRESLEVYDGRVKLMRTPLEEKIFVYLTDGNGLIIDKIKEFVPFENTIEVGHEYDGQVIVVDYYFNYERNYSQYVLGSKRIDGLLTLEGKAYFKDDIYGMNKTFFFEIPKMKITSNLDVIMGEKASPTVSVFNIVGLPIKENNQMVVAKMNLLSEDIDSDI